MLLALVLQKNSEKGSMQVKISGMVAILGIVLLLLAAFQAIMNF